MINLSTTKNNNMSCDRLENLDIKITKLYEKVKEVALKNGFSRELKDKVRMELNYFSKKDSPKI